MYLISNINLASNLPIVVVGCGGTGSLVAEGLCRLFLDRPEVNVVLVDMDRVEAHNIARQNFHPGEVGRFKTEALAQRLSQAYGREISYSTSPWSNGVYKDIFMQQPAPNMVALSSGLIIGCLDNAPARAAVLETLTTGFTFSTKSVWWLDAGNGRDSGQVLIGNAPPDKLAGTFLNGPEVVLNLPFPTVQQPALLVPTVDARPAVDCAQAVVAGDQSPTINQAMATVVLEYTRRLLQGTLPWMATYLDLHAGTMTSVAATPEQVARLTGVPVKTLVHQWPGPKPCHWCGGIHEQQAPHEW